jgi:hypothetical protein
MAPRVYLALRPWRPTRRFLGVKIRERVNDAHGHARGERVFREAAGTLRSELRGFDALYRPCGEEFVVALPGLDDDQGALIAERLRAAVESAQPGGLRVTASFGVAAGSDPHALHEAADGALYASKRQGRNGCACSRRASANRSPSSGCRRPSREREQLSLAAQFAALAVIGAFLLFGERLTRTQVAGLVAIAIGVAALSAQRPRRSSGGLGVRALHGRPRERERPRLRLRRLALALALPLLAGRRRRRLLREDSRLVLAGQ